MAQAFFRCPKCSQRYAFKEAMAGKAVKCQKCGQAFKVPTPQAAAGPQSQSAPSLVPPVPAPAAPSAPLPPLPPVPQTSSGLDDLLDDALPPLAGGPAAAAPLPPAPVSAAPLAAQASAAPARKPAKKRRSESSSWELSDKDKQRLWSGLGVMALGLLGFVLPVHRFLGRRGRFLPPSAYPALSVICTLIGLGMVLWALRRKLNVALPGAGGVLVLMVILFIVSPYRQRDDSDDSASPPAAASVNAAMATVSKAPGTAQELVSLQQEATAGFNRLGDLLATVQDQQTARSAIPEVRTTIDRLNATLARMSVLEEQGMEVPAEQQKQLAQQHIAATMKVFAQVARLETIPGLDELKKEVERLDEDVE